jgi:hypothetical protein
MCWGKSSAYLYTKFRILSNNNSLGLTIKKLVKNITAGQHVILQSTNKIKYP